MPVGGIYAAAVIFSIVTATVKKGQKSPVLMTATAGDGDETWEKIKRFVKSTKKDAMLFVLEQKDLIRYRLKS